MKLTPSMHYAHPKKYSFSDILGQTIPHGEAMKLLQSDSKSYQVFQTLPTMEQENILSFIQGNKGLKILNDKVFRHVMNPAVHPNRLNSMLSSILGQKVSVYDIIPREGDCMVEGGSFVIMDILVSLADGTTINVEVQRVGYLFPGERSSCYLSDLIMRQYNLVHSIQGKNFSYKNLKPVILIVLMENSSGNFTAVAPRYIHREQVTYDSGAKVTNLSHTIYISLDTFRSVVQNISTELDAWLTFLGSDSPNDIVKLVNTYPEFVDCYKDIVEFRRHPKELMTMYSEALAILDRNTELYMVDEMKATISEQADTIANLTETVTEVKAQLDAALAEIARLKNNTAL